MKSIKLNTNCYFCLSLALILLFNFNSLAQLNNIRIEKLPVVSGLSFNVETAIQDSKGFLWIGTQDGLCRFDGSNFKTYKTDINDTNSIQNSDIRTICEVSNGNLLLGGGWDYNPELIEYNYNSDNFRKINLPIRITAISSITEDMNGNIWVGTLGNGLYKLDKDKNFLFHYEKDSMNNSKTINATSITCLYYDSKLDKLFIGTSGGLNVLDMKSHRFSYILFDSTNPNSLSNKISCIFRDSRKILWIGTSGGGLNEFDEKNNTLKKYKHDQNFENNISNDEIISMCEDDQGCLWIATKGPELNCFEYNKNKFTQITLTKKSEIYNKVSCLFKDKTNVIWLGTYWDGIHKIDRGQKRFKTILNKNSKQDSLVNIFDLIEYSDSIIFYKAGENKYFEAKIINEENIVFNNIEEIKNKEVYNISKDLNGNLWLTTRQDGLFSIIVAEGNMNNISYYNFKEFVEKNWVFTQLNDKNNPDLIWLGFGYNGLMKFDRSKEKTIDTLGIPNSLKKITVSALFMDSKNILWIGSQKSGLFRYDISENTVTNYTFNPDDSESIADNYVCSINEDNNNIWVGTGMGLNKLDKVKNKFKRFTEKDGLSGTWVWGILTDDFNNLWFSTVNGLNKFNTVSQTFNNYFETDGLIYNYFNEGSYYKSPDGTMYFGGLGITYFNPNEIKDNPYVPNIVITDFKIFNEAVKPSPENPFLKKNITVAKDITLSYKESVFSFEFAALIYNNPLKNQNAYMMEGFDKDWVYSGTRRNVTYTNLDPGDYTFRVKGSNNDGIWNEEGTSIKITITPPWWQTWWFKSCGAAMVFLTAGYGYKKRVNKLKKEKSAQEEFSKKLLNSQEEERKKIASVLHDSIAHDVLITKNSSEIGLRSAGENEEVKEMFSKISEQSSSTLNELRRIQFNLHPYEVEKLGLTKAIKSIVDRVSKSTEIKFTFEEDFIDKVFSEENEIHLYRIIQEAVNNIIKHSSATEAIIKINRTDENVLITISDNGKGFSKNYALRKNSMGLSGISERVKLLGGSLETDSESGNGTQLRITLPVV